MSDARTVLIVEDDVAFADFLRAAVESVGHRAVVVNNAVEALPAFAKHRPDFVMIDILLPQGDGFEVCTSIRAHERGAAVPIALMTGIYKKASYERKGLQECKANEYVHKPFGVQALWRMLEKHLGAVTGDAEPEEPEECVNLAEKPLVDLLAEHVENDSNGVLFVRSRGTTYAVYLQWGDPVFIRSNDPADRLHEVLRRSGQVTSEQVEEAVQAVAESRGSLRLGQALVRRGSLTEDQFQVALQLQLRLIFQHAFQLTEGTCSFIQGSHPTEEDVLLAIRPKALLLLGAKSAGARRAVAAALPPGSAALSRSGDFDSRQEELELKHSERALAQLVDGHLTVGRFRAIAEAAGADGTAILHGFLLTGLLSAGEAEETESDATDCKDWDSTRFAQLPVAAAIADLHRVGASGTLQVRAATNGPAKHVVFRAGRLAAVQSDVEEDRLSDMLLRLHLMGESELDEVLKTFGGVEPDDRALARAIVSSGQILPLQVYWAAVYQAQAAVHGLFGMVGAKLTWTGGEEPMGLVGLPDMPTSEIVLAAVRSLAGPTLLALLPPKTAWFRARPAAESSMTSMPLTDEERALLERLAEPASLQELLASQPQAKTEVRRRLYGLMSCGLVGEVPTPAAEHGGDDRHEVHEVSEDDGTSFLDMLHEDGFSTGRTGQHAAVAATDGAPLVGPSGTASKSMEEPIELPLGGASEPLQDRSEVFLFDDEPAPPVDKAVEEQPEKQVLESLGPGVQEPIDDLLSCSFDEADGSEDPPLSAPEHGLADSCRELITRLVAGKTALAAGSEGLEAQRAALTELLADCEVLARRVVEEVEESAPELEAVPSGSGSAR